jgi:hypothetical protein
MNAVHPDVSEVIYRPESKEISPPFMRMGLRVEVTPIPDHAMVTREYHLNGLRNRGYSRF